MTEASDKTHLMSVFYKIILVFLAVCLVAQTPLCSAQTAGDSFVCGRSIVSDVDGNIYNTVQIGSQCWMRENLRATRYSDCTPVSLGTSISATTAFRYAPNNDEDNVLAYGYLYNWAALMYGSGSSTANPSGVQGICPAGWHVPSDAEWAQLTDYVSSQSQYLCGGNNGYIAKALASAMGWNSSSNTCTPGNNPSGNNATGFSAVPSGFYDGSYSHFLDYADFWSSTEVSSLSARDRNLSYGNVGVYCDNDSKGYGHSVRCLKDVEGLPTVRTETATASSCGSAATVSAVVEVHGESGLTERGVCYSASPNPTVADRKVVDPGTADNYTCNLSGLVPGTIYVCAYATNGVGTSYGNQLIFDVGFRDVDGNAYGMVQIGSQCWMSENLRTTKYSDGTPIALGTDISETTAYRYAPDDYESNVPTYGYLYNWAAVMNGSGSSSANPSGVQGVCPAGWHVPSSAEWTQLTGYVNSQNQYLCGGNNGYIAKALASATGWSSNSAFCAVGNNPSENNATGFAVVPAGIYDGNFSNFSYGAYFWSSTEDISGFAYSRYFRNEYPYVTHMPFNNEYGHSVRCLRN